MNLQQENMTGKEFKELFASFVDVWKMKLEMQKSVQTFNDHIIDEAVKIFETSSALIQDEDTLSHIITRISEYVPEKKVKAIVAQVLNWHQGRFVEFAQRANDEQDEVDEVADLCLVKSQGEFECLQWKDLHLFKSVFDLGIYQMLLWELQPKTIIEIGAGNGSNAVWVADLLKSFGLECHVYSLDINIPCFQYEDVTFIQGDFNKIEAGMTESFLSELPHPWLVIEDAHVNVTNVLSHFACYMSTDDYLVVEDSGRKQADVADFLSDKAKQFVVDTKYCDFFGRNMTCSHNSILKKVK